MSFITGFGQSRRITGGASALSLSVALTVGAAGLGCTDDDVAPLAEHPAVREDFTRADGFFSSPFPSETRRDEAGVISIDGFPNPTDTPFVNGTFEMLAGVRGFARTGGIFMSLTSPLSETFGVDVHTSIGEDSPVFLINVDTTMDAEAGARHPIDVEFRADGGPFGADNLLSMVPLQGIPMAANTRYAAIVTTDVTDARGEHLAVSQTAIALRDGVAVAGMGPEATQDFEDALEVARATGVDASHIAGMTVFRTGDPEKEFRAVLDDALARPMPTVSAPPVLTDTFDDFCVYESSLPMPVYQAGEPPYTTQGDWRFTAGGAPIHQRDEEARIVITIPRTSMPTDGFPVVLFSRTGGGGDRPLVDRGPRGEPGGEALKPGTGPAITFARAGFAGVSVDGPHGGTRNATGGDEQFLIFNIGNPIALRDNVRQSAMELALQAHVLESLTFATEDCPGADSSAQFDTATLTLMGHSMGATISPLSVSAEPRFKALMLSGAGGSWIENVVFKQSPLPVRPAAELLIGVAGWYQIHRHDPLLTLFQWAAEPSDPPVYAERIAKHPPEAPRSVLMMQGIVDTYILPPIANATSLSIGLDLGGDALDEEDPELTMFAPLSTQLSFSHRNEIALPAAGNVGTATAVVVQHRQDGVEDGHEVVFQTEAPKHQMRCFLESLAKGGPPVVVPPGAERAPCPSQ